MYEGWVARREKRTRREKSSAAQERELYRLLAAPQIRGWATGEVQPLLKLDVAAVEGQGWQPTGPFWKQFAKATGLCKFGLIIRIRTP